MEEPLALGDSVEVGMRVKDGGMKLVGILTPDFRWQSGNADIELRLHGRPGALALDGGLHVSKATITSPFLKYPMTNVAAAVNLADNVVQVRPPAPSWSLPTRATTACSCLAHRSRAVQHSSQTHSDAPEMLLGKFGALCGVGDRPSCLMQRRVASSVVGRRWRMWRPRWADEGSSGPAGTSPSPSLTAGSTALSHAAARTAGMPSSWTSTTSSCGCGTCTQVPPLQPYKLSSTRQARRCHSGFASRPYGAAQVDTAWTRGHGVHASFEKGIAPML